MIFNGLYYECCHYKISENRTWIGQSVSFFARRICLLQVKKKFILSKVENNWLERASRVQKVH